MKALLKIFQIALCAILIIGVIACAPRQEVKLEGAPAYPKTSFIVFSDPHQIGRAHV